MSWGAGIAGVSSRSMARNRGKKKGATGRRQDVSAPSFWEQLYNRGNPGWDLGQPTPVLKKWLSGHRGKGEKVCILGAGNGYDAVAFAKAGYSVVAVDFAPTPLRYLSGLAHKGKLPIEVVAQDMFYLPEKWNGRFDLIFEYTTYCAIDPRRRNEYVALIKRLLNQQGRLVALFFPMDQDPAVGPPYGVSYDEIAQRFGRHFIITSEEWPELSVASRRLRELFVVMDRR